MLSIAVACALAAVYTVLFLSYMPFNRAVVARRDFIVYWATGQQLARHGNPYDPDALNRIEREAGFQGGGSFYMRNTPWALPLAVPLGYIGPMASALPWSLAMLGLLAASVRILWKLFGGRGGHLDWLGYCFPPALCCVLLGQTSNLLLFGLALFLRYHKTRPFAAGAALWFCTLKPHLFLPFALVMLIWIVVSRSYRILAGGATAFLAGGLLTTWVDPSAWSQYAYYMRTSVITREFTPCLGAVIRDSIHPAWEWLAFVPAMIGGVWAVAWFWPRRREWDWMEHGNLLVLVSLFVAPFGWIFDQAIAIPAILFAVCRGTSQTMLTILALLCIAVELLFISRFGLHSTAYLWTAPAWLVWYLFARASSRRTSAAAAG
ncbi:MAG: glycosyltransferase family 87 protein [Terracidiphilus sp.]|jgi:hypothetical protein